MRIGRAAAVRGGAVPALAVRRDPRAHGLVDGVVGARLADRVGVPLLVTEHASTAADELADPEAADALPAAHWHATRGGGIVAVSRSLASAVGLAARAGGWCDRACSRTPCRSRGSRRGRAGDRSPGELLYVGSRKASKGIERLLRAFAIVRGARPTCELRLIGSPGTADEEAEWWRLVGELGVAEGMRWRSRGRARETGRGGHAARRNCSSIRARARHSASSPPRHWRRACRWSPRQTADATKSSDRTGGSAMVARGMEPEDLAAAIGEGLERAAPRRTASTATACAATSKGRTRRHPWPLGRSSTTSSSGAADRVDAPRIARRRAAPRPSTRRPWSRSRAARPSSASTSCPRRCDRRTTIVTSRRLPAASTPRRSRRTGAGSSWRSGPPTSACPAINATLRRLVDGDGWLVGLDADDVLAIEPALGDGVDLAPGGLRWLADRDDEAAGDR